MEETYTYTARSADNPEEVVTFTLYDHSLFIDVGVPLEHVERALEARRVGAEEAEIEAGEEGGALAEAEDEGEEGYAIKPWLKPMAISAMERGIHPFNVADVDANAQDSSLKVSAWVRAGGLRVAPVVIIMARVDNPEAAQGFVKELKRRQETASYPGRFPGLLDYWASWIVGGLAATTALAVWLRKRYQKAA